MTDPTAFGYANWRFSWGDHICAFFDDHAQQMETMVPFLAQGLRAKQRCVWVAPPASCDHLRKWLAAIGADLPTLEASGQLVVLSDVAFYLQDGVFEPERTIALGLTLLADGQRQGYSTMRITSDISWSHAYRLDPEVWEQYELQVTAGTERQPLVAICQYDRRQISGGIIVAALRTHRLVLMDGQLYENPFYRPAPGAVVQLT
jgi:hypothetical protein